ncbi:MAG: inositol monophosphatase, partial [Candidatus Marinimicrobia bacterium]|nr:inositol monophosphatase [Candidatus Neomarinimicrobiota bacterium]
MIFEELLDVAIKAAHLSSDIILEFSDKSKVVDYKGRTDLVTIADKKSEKLIIDTILDKFQD